MENKQYTKCFYNRETESTYKTLKAANEAQKYSHIFRCWMLDGEIKVMRQITTPEGSICTIKAADKDIVDALEKGMVGKCGYKDKRMIG